MVSIHDGRILGKHLVKILEAISSGTLDPIKAIERGYEELRKRYIATGNNKSVLKTDGGYSQDESRFEEILEYVEENYPEKLTFQEDDGKKKSTFRIDCERMGQSIGEAQSESPMDLGDLVKKTKDEKVQIIVVSEVELRKRHSQLSTVNGCYDILESYSLQVTSENRGNVYGHFLGIYGIYQNLLEENAREKIDVTQERSRGHGLFVKVNNAFNNRISQEEKIRNNAFLIYDAAKKKRNPQPKNPQKRNRLR